jgi:hypothetical protein
VTLRLPIALVLVAGLLAGCGSDPKPGGPPGSPANPLAAKTQPGSEGASRRSQSSGQSFRKIVERQSRHPERRFTPCDLVTKAQARAILRAPLQDLMEAPQGPTCIYRSQDGERFVTVAVQSSRFGQLKRQLSDRRSVDVSGRTGYCGRYGQPLLYVPVSAGRVLTVAARCATARRFAITSLGRLHG